ncbi:LCP family protein [Halobacillus yeomjeoni]|uniref:LCP family protein n=1 Tax=Halobacillus yeomjeoni TaxID=311194 RepID=UPI001CD34E42|nr:LCP family protein [Halobacillus yeomjeoni]MCA0984693.1 LCP family protein [Halobacillus yeomjeoni]
MSKRMERIRRRNIKKKRRRIATILIMFALLIGGGFYFVSQVYTAAFTDLNRGDKSDKREEAVDIGDDPISILLMGVEDYSTNGEAGRADTQIVMTLDPKTNKITMTSVPRDTRVTIPEEKVGRKYAGQHKINAAYSMGEVSGYGGERLTVETVEEYLDIPIDKFATVNFDGFIEIVNLLDGVEVDVKESFWERSSLDWYKKIEFDEGPMVMDGEEALAFVRMRKREANLVYPREERQRQFIRAAINEAISAGTLFKAGDIADVLGENVSTNLSPRELYSIQKVFSSKKSTTQSYSIEGENKRLENGLYYFVPSDEGLKEIQTKLKKELGLVKAPDKEQSNQTSA